MTEITKSFNEKNEREQKQSTRLVKKALKDFHKNFRSDSLSISSKAIGSLVIDASHVENIDALKSLKPYKKLKRLCARRKASLTTNMATEITPNHERRIVSILAAQ